MPSARPIVISAVLALAAASAPATAAAAKGDPLAGTRLQSIRTLLDLKSERCPADTDFGTDVCGSANLESRFRARRPDVRRLRDGSLRIAGTGTSECSSESPTPPPIMNPDGSAQLLGPATQYRPGSFASIDLGLRPGKRGLRFTWTEPAEPAVACDYAYGEGSVSLDETAVSDPYRIRKLKKRRRFSVEFGATREDVRSTAPDGSAVSTYATWRVVLVFVRAKQR